MGNSTQKFKFEGMFARDTKEPFIQINIIKLNELLSIINTFEEQR